MSDLPLSRISHLIANITAEGTTSGLTAEPYARRRPGPADFPHARSAEGTAIWPHDEVAYRNPTSFRLPSLAEIGYVAGLAVMLSWAKGEKT